MLSKKKYKHVMVIELIVLSVLLLALLIHGGMSAYAAVEPDKDYLVHGGSIAVGDFNKDGHPDIVVGTSLPYDSGPTVLLNKGNGSFAPGVRYLGGAYLRSVVVGDFNGDGYPDLAALAYGKYGIDSVSVLLNKGDGTFAPGVSYPGANAAVALVVGDFNGDGYPDLAVFNVYGAVGILLNKGDGTFPSGSSSAIGKGLSEMVVGDFNGDGHPDLAAISSVSGMVTVLLNNGDGTFGPQPGHFVEPNLNTVAVGDFNKDGHVDLAVSNAQGRVVILAGKGDGTFRPGKAVSHASLGSLIAVDFNGDGYPDLVGIAQQGNAVDVLLNKGDGTFGSGPAYKLAGAYTVAVADFNGDGQPDLAVIDSAGLSVRLIKPLPDLAIGNTNQGGQDFVVGQQVRYTLTVSNGTPGGVIEQGKTIAVTDTIPAGLQGIAVQGTDWQMSLNSTNSSVSSPLVITALYIGGYPVGPGQVLPLLTINGVVTKDAVPSLQTIAKVTTKNDRNIKNNASVDTIYVKAAT